jgi:hypothetical protein
MSVVLDLSAYPVVCRDDYVTELLHGLCSVRERKFRPHWIVFEEAQQFLPPAGNALSVLLLPLMALGGWALVSYRPDRLAAPVLSTLSHCLLTRLSEPEAGQAVGQSFNLQARPPGSLPRGYVWHSDDGLVRLRATARRVAHIRHRYKYLDQPLPRHKRFYFRNEQGFIGLEAASLLEFLQILPTLPIASLVYHHRRGDFAAWAHGALGDGILAAHLQKLAHRSLEAETLREALLQRVTDHYAELYAMR